MLASFLLCTSCTILIIIIIKPIYLDSYATCAGAPTVRPAINLRHQRPHSIKYVARIFLFGAFQYLEPVQVFGSAAFRKIDVY